MASIPTKDPEHEAMAVAAWIRRVLAEAGITQKEAAKSIGSPSLKTFSSRLSRGYIDAVMLIRIAALVGASDISLSEIVATQYKRSSPKRNRRT